MNPLILSILILFLLTTPVFAQDAVTQTSPQYSDGDKKEFITELGVVYIGMPKSDLYKVFSKLQQKNYYKEGNEEWLTFSDWMTEESGDLITFYLVDGKVKGWKGKQGYSFRFVKRAVSRTTWKTSLKLNAGIANSMH